MQLKVTLGFALLALASLISSFELQGIARYRAMPLCHLKNNASKDTAPQISFVFRKFDQNDCKKYLGRTQIIKRCYQPIQIQIRNNTDKLLEFSLDTFSFPCISYLDVAKEVYFNTGLRLFLWGVGTVIVPILIVPFIIEAVESPRANAALEDDYACKSLFNQVIEPYGTINGIIFVETNQFDPNFSFILSDQTSNQKFELSTMHPQISIK